MCKYFVLLGSSAGEATLTGPEWKSTNDRRVSEDIHSWLAPFLQQLQLWGSFTCTGTIAAAAAASVCSQRHCRHQRVSERSKPPLRILHTHARASQHPQSSPTILCTPRSAGLVTAATVASLCPWNDPGDAEEADLRDLAPTSNGDAMMLKQGVGGAKTPGDAEARGGRG